MLRNIPPVSVDYRVPQAHDTLCPSVSCILSLQWYHISMSFYLSYHLCSGNLVQLILVLHHLLSDRVHTCDVYLTTYVDKNIYSKI